jgi:phosphoserine phosphatase
LLIKSSQLSTSKLDETRQKLLNAEAVCFDVDSTVIIDEGINVLAEYKGVGEQVADLTQR